MITQMPVLIIINLLNVVCYRLKTSFFNCKGIFAIFRVLMEKDECEFNK